ncbi:MAG: M28 family peptidase [Mariniblastus sp.]|nr:M28 family peptidase [Mariniblastus sp.]
MMRIYWPYQTIGLALAISLNMTGFSQGQVEDQESRFPGAAEQEVAQQWISENALKADIKFLADDLLEGRGPGTRGDDLAQRYIVSQFEQMGLEPAAPSGGWIQKVPLVGVTTKPPQTITFQEDKQDLTLQNYQDYILTSGLPNEESGFENAEVIFAGYGMQAPEYDWDDFKDVDVKGKVLIVMNNDPADRPQIFAGRTRLYYGRWDYKYAKAAELGAAGVFIIHTTPSAGYPYQVVQTSWTGEQMALGGEVQGRLPMEGWLTEEAARKVVGLAGKNLDQLRAAAEKPDFQPVPLGMTVSVNLKCQVRQRETGNVLGLLPGTDPELSKEWIVFMAHHDHIGMTPARDDTTDNIYNGAVDNASGTAVLMAIARAVMSLPESKRPKRSILFAAVGAEEQGLLGSEFMARNPPVPAGYLAAVLNIDGVNILGRTEDVVVIGKGKSDMDPIIERLARWQKRVVVGDQFPDRGYYYRSDQFSLAKVGVPGVYLGAGVHVIGKPDGWGRQKLREWTENIYHQTSDEYSPDWDLSGAVQDARLMFYAGMQAANQANFPAWTKGDEFEAARLQAIGQRDSK